MKKTSYKSVAKSLNDTKNSWLNKYGQLVIGNNSLIELFMYELLTSFFGSIPGGLGIYLREHFYKSLFNKFRHHIIIGKNVYFTQPKKISIGNQVIIGIGTHLDVKGEPEAGIIIEDKVSIGHGTILRSRMRAKIKIGYNTALGDNTHIAAGADVSVGKNVLGAPFLTISAGSHEFCRTDIPIRKQPGYALGVIVEDNVWFGSCVKVLDGVRVGRDSIIGAGSVVTKEVPPWSIAFGVPAKVVKKRK